MFINLTNFSNYYLSQILQYLEMDVVEKFLDRNRFQLLDPLIDLVMTTRCKRIQ